MVIIKIMGGLGNQLSIYARGYSLARYLKQELVLDISDYMQRGYFRPYVLDKLKIGKHRKLMYPPAAEDFDGFVNLPQIIQDKSVRLITDELAGNREKLLQEADGAQNVYLLGYGGRQYCTLEELERLCTQFQLKEPSSAVEMFKKRIENEYSVAVHIRRTDFVELNMQDSQRYFCAAITYIRSFHPEAQFYFFSDDIAYVKETFGNCAGYHYVQLLGGMDADLDEFFCISSCTCRILSHKSSFSSWASVLNRCENKLDISRAEDNGISVSEKTIYLTSAAVETFSAWYRPEEKKGEAESPDVTEETAYRLVAEGQNEKAISIIDRACMDSYTLTERRIQELSDLKAIALAQGGKSFSAAALRTFYQQMQTRMEDPVFHANFFLTLYHSGRILESAIHAALANRYGDQEDYTEYFQSEASLDLLPLELYCHLKDSAVRHFIFVPVEGWNYYIGYVKTIAVLLARMGQKVTFFSESGTVRIPEGRSADDKEVARIAFERSREADHTYRYHLQLLPVIVRFDENGHKVMFDETLRQCVDCSEMPTIVVASNPGILTWPKIKNVRYVIPDICDPLNPEKYTGGIDDIKDYVSSMLEYADDVFLSGSLFEEFKARYPKKLHEAFPGWVGGKHAFLDTELDFTENYISSESMIRNAFEIYKLTVK